MPKASATIDQKVDKDMQGILQAVRSTEDASASTSTSTNPIMDKIVELSGIYEQGDNDNNNPNPAPVDADTLGLTLLGRTAHGLPKDVKATVKKWHNNITSHKALASFTEKARKVKADVNADKKAYRNYKANNVPWSVIPGGIFRALLQKNEMNCQRLTGVGGFECDKLATEEEYAEVAKLVQSKPNTVLAYKSVSGTGMHFHVHMVPTRGLVEAVVGHDAIDISSASAIPFVLSVIYRCMWHSVHDNILTGDGDDSWGLTAEQTDTNVAFITQCFFPAYDEDAYYSEKVEPIVVGASAASYLDKTGPVGLDDPVVKFNWDGRERSEVEQEQNFGVTDFLSEEEVMVAAVGLVNPTVSTEKAVEAIEALEEGNRKVGLFKTAVKAVCRVLFPAMKMAARAIGIPDRDIIPTLTRALNRGMKFIAQEARLLTAYAETTHAYAEKFVHKYKGELLSCVGDNKWYLYNKKSGLWQEDERRDVLHLIGKFMAALEAVRANEEGKSRNSFSNAGAYANALRIVRTDPTMNIKTFNENPNVLATHDKKKIVFSGEGEDADYSIEELKRDDYVTLQLGTAVSEDPDKKPERFLQFLDETLPPATNKGAKEFLQRIFGYMLLGKPALEQILLYFYDNKAGGGTGKTTLIDTLCHVLGDYSGSVSGSRLILGHSQHSQWKIPLIGLRLIKVPELPKGNIDEDLVNAMVGGEELEANPMREGSIRFKLSAVMFVASNHAPRASVNTGFWRRLVLVPCLVRKRRKDGTADPHLPMKLRNEAPEILRWMLDGARDYLRYGLGDVPLCFEEATRDAKDGASLIAQFMSRCLVFVNDEKDDTAWLPQSRLPHLIDNFAHAANFHGVKIDSYSLYDYVRGRTKWPGQKSKNDEIWKTKAKRKRDPFTGKSTRPIWGVKLRESVPAIWMYPRKQVQQYEDSKFAMAVEEMLKSKGGR